MSKLSNLIQALVQIFVYGFALFQYIDELGCKNTLKSRILKVLAR